MNFRQLIDKARAKGRLATDTPLTMSWVAWATGISRAQIYNYIDGVQTAPAWSVAKIALGLGLTKKVVESALEQSRAESEVTS